MIETWLELSPNPRRLKRHGALCPKCNGLGFDGPGPGGWPTPCKTCGGRGAFRTRDLVKRLRVHRRDLYRVEEMRAGKRVGLRVLDAIAREFPEALTC